MLIVVGNLSIVGGNAEARAPCLLQQDASHLVTTPKARIMKEVGQVAIRHMMDHEQAVWDAETQYNLGVITANGQGVPQDTEQAVAWFRKAAEQRYAGAQYALGIMYQNGDGVPQDDEQALLWFRRAAQGMNWPDENRAEYGDARAQYILGVTYRDWCGAPRDYEQAFLWFRRAAEKGHTDAQHALGVMYQNGDGVPQDTEQALLWFRKAAEQGHSDAREALKSLDPENPLPPFLPQTGEPPRR